MKLCLVGPTHPYRGGISHYNTRLHYELEKKGSDLVAVNFKRMYPGFLFPGKTQYDDSKRGFTVPSERLLDSINPLSWRATARFIKSRKPEAVIFHWWMPFFGPSYGSVLKKISKGCGKRVLICHNVRPHEQSGIDRVLSLLAFRHADRFLVHSEQDRENLLEILPEAIVAKNPHPIYDLFTDDSAEGTTFEKRENERFNILFFGYVREYKGLRYLLRAMPKILDRVNVQLKVAGEFYDDKQPYLKIIEELGIEDRVDIEDRYIPNEEVPHLFKEADLVVVPYREATQSGIVQISYNFGVPVVVTRVGGLPEVVHDGETGYIIEPGSSGAVADAVVDFFAGNRALEFRNNILEKRKEFSWEKLVGTLEGLLR